jgi:outer membrane protein OmpA-like peptidoglycan-associated protein
LAPRKNIQEVRMRFGTPELAAHRARQPVHLSLALLLCVLTAGPALAQDKPNLKDLLGRVQSESETKAVEDLVDKLKGTARKPTKPPESMPAPAASPGTGTTPAPASPPEIAKEQPATTPPQVASPSSPPPGSSSPEAKPELKPDEAVRRAEAKEAPSIDLEIYFDYKSAEVTPKAVAVLNTLGRALSDARLADDSFLIAGHTDAKGGAAYNLELSQRRAQAVRQFLIANFKVDAQRLIAKGYGLQRLKTPTDPLAAANRRVQIVNLSKDQR